MINFNRPTIEDVDALCGIDTLPPGRFEIAVQMGKKTNMKKGDRVLVIHGTKGNQADVYSSEFEVDIVEIALNSEESDTSENDFPLDIKENSFDIVTDLQIKVKP